MSRTRNYRDLLLWQKAMELARTVYVETEGFPQAETFGLRMQMRRSAVAVPSHIAEGHGKLTDADFRKSLSNARGALFEFETQTELSSGLGFLKQDVKKKLFEMTSEIAKLIHGLLGALQQ